MTKGLNVYKIEKSDLGFDLTFGGDMTKAELEKWYKESDRVLTGRHGPFGVIIDMRTLAPLPADAQAVMVRGSRCIKAVVCNAPASSCTMPSRPSSLCDWPDSPGFQSTNAISMLRHTKSGDKKQRTGSGTPSLPRRERLGGKSSRQFMTKASSSIH